jgi:hypothetical protein
MQPDSGFGITRKRRIIMAIVKWEPFGELSTLRRQIGSSHGFLRNDASEPYAIRNRREKMLQIDDLQVKLGDKEIPPGETHILFGPNGKLFLLTA